MSTAEIVSIAGAIISLLTAISLVPPYFAMKSVIKNYKLQPLKTEEDISSGFMNTAVAANTLAKQLQTQMNDLATDDLILKNKIKKLETMDSRKTDIIRELRIQIRKLKLKIIRLEKEILRLKEEIAKTKKLAIEKKL
jgi:hypothetical protein